MSAGSVNVGAGKLVVWGNDVHDQDWLMLKN